VNCTQAQCTAVHRDPVHSTHRYGDGHSQVLIIMSLLKSIMYSSVLYSIALIVFTWCTVLYSTVLLYCTVLYCTYGTVLYCAELYVFASPCPQLDKMLEERGTRVALVLSFRIPDSDVEDSPVLYSTELYACASLPPAGQDAGGAGNKSGVGTQLQNPGLGCGGQYCIV